MLSGSDWKRVRQHVEEPFSRPSAARYTAGFVALAQDYLQTTALVSADLSLKTQGVICIEPAKALQFYPFLAVAQILFGTIDPDQRKKLLALAPLREELFKEVIRGGINRLPIASYLQSPGARLLGLFQADWEIFVKSAYEAAVERNQSPIPVVVILWEAYQSGAISKREVSVSCIHPEKTLTSPCSVFRPSMNLCMLTSMSPHMPSLGTCCCWPRMAGLKRSSVMRCYRLCKTRQRRVMNDSSTERIRFWQPVCLNPHDYGRYCVRRIRKHGVKKMKWLKFHPNSILQSRICPGRSIRGWISHSAQCR